MLTLTRRYDLECAHQLKDGLPDRHHCRRLHGHRYEVEITVSGAEDENGILIEYADLDTVVGPILKLADHHSLNDLNERCSTPEAAAVAANPTVERLVLWLAVRLCCVSSAMRGMGLVRVSAQEDARSSAAWTA